MRISKWIAQSALVVIFVGACSSEDSLGKKNNAQFGAATDGAAGGGAFTGVAMCQRTEPIPTGGMGGVSGANDPTLIGKWVGYFETETSTQPKFVTVLIEDSAMNGAVVFGENLPPAPPPPTDPDTGYPADFAISMGGAPNVPYEGFRYTIFDGDVVDARVRFALSMSELWKDWCPLQASYDWGPLAAGICSCVPNWTAHGSREGSSPQFCDLENPDTKQLIPTSCAQLALCRLWPIRACECSGSGCRATFDHDSRFDLQHQGENLDGSLEYFWGKITVHLNRVSPAGASP